MGSFIQIEFGNISGDQSDLLIAQLNEVGFTGFEEGANLLKAFIPEEDYNKELFLHCLMHDSIPYTESRIPETNWNRVWESSFDPVIVDDFVAIRADFHEPITGVLYEIIITPKMSFGTGHHATTHMMIDQMRKLDFTRKSVFDFGTGTGVLAILAEKSGAAKVLATDIDKWSIENAKENIAKNNCSAIDLRLSDSANVQGEFDIILANINKSVIIDNLNHFHRLLAQKGTLCLSGVLPGDRPDLVSKCEGSGFKLNFEIQRDNWLFLSLSHEGLKY